LQKLTITHVRNWQENRRRVGYGHLYQGRYKSFPVESDEHFYQVARYVPAQCTSGEPRRAGRRVAVEQSLATGMRHRGRPAVARQVAAPPAAQLANVREPTANGR
jgi:hypothetical protein